MKVEPVHGEAALLVDGDRRLLVIADLHIGIEFEFHESGITLPSQTPSLIQRTRSLLDDLEPDVLLLLGDVKNTVDRVSRQEMEEVPRYLRALQDVEVHIVIGNHDSLLTNLLPPDVMVHDARGVVMEGVGFFHGHTYPSPEVASAEVMVLGHQHPSLAFRDDLGTRMVEPCWVRAPPHPAPFLKRYGFPPAGEVIVMPAFSEYGQGSPVNEGEEFLGPFLKGGFADMDNAEIYLLDGVHLGKLSDLRALAGRPPGA